MPLDTLYYAAVAFVINRGARTFDHNVVVGIVVLLGGGSEEVVVVAILLVTGKTQVDPFEFSHGFPANMASFRIRQHHHSLALGVVPAEDELWYVDKPATVTDQHDSACRAIQLADIFGQSAAAERAMCFSVSSPRSHSSTL